MIKILATWKNKSKRNVNNELTLSEFPIFVLSNNIPGTLTQSLTKIPLPDRTTDPLNASGWSFPMKNMDSGRQAPCRPFSICCKSGRKKTLRANIFISGRYLIYWNAAAIVSDGNNIIRSETIFLIYWESDFQQKMPIGIILPKPTSMSFYSVSLINGDRKIKRQS